MMNTKRRDFVVAVIRDAIADSADGWGWKNEQRLVTYASELLDTHLPDLLADAALGQAVRGMANWPVPMRTNKRARVQTMALVFARTEVSPMVLAPLGFGICPMVFNMDASENDWFDTPEGAMRKVGLMDKGE